MVQMDYIKQLKLSNFRISAAQGICKNMLTYNFAYFRFLVAAIIIITEPFARTDITQMN